MRALHVQEQRQDCCLYRDIEGHHRLVSPYQLWLPGKGAGRGPALFPAAGEVTRASAGHRTR